MWGQLHCICCFGLNSLWHSDLNEWTSAWARLVQISGSPSFMTAVSYYSWWTQVCSVQLRKHRFPLMKCKQRLRLVRDITVDCCQWFSSAVALFKDKYVVTGPFKCHFLSLHYLIGKSHLSHFELTQKKWNELDIFLWNITLYHLTPTLVTAVLREHSGSCSGTFGCKGWPTFVAWWSWPPLRSSSALCLILTLFVKKAIWWQDDCL